MGVDCGPNKSYLDFYIAWLEETSSSGRPLGYPSQMQMDREIFVLGLTVHLVFLFPQIDHNQFPFIRSLP